MHKRLTVAFCALLFIEVAALAQSVGPVPNPGGNPGPQFTMRTGHLGFGNSATPTANASCGTGATVTGTDAAFALNTGTSSTSACKVTFAVAFGGASGSHFPVCTMQSVVASAFTVALSGVTLSGGSVDSTLYNFICIGRSN